MKKFVPMKNTGIIKWAAHIFIFIKQCTEGDDLLIVESEMRNG